MKADCKQKKIITRHIKVKIWKMVLHGGKMINTDVQQKFFLNLPEVFSRTDNKQKQKDKDRKYNQIAALAEKAKTGDRASLEQLTELFHKDIFRMVYYRTRSRMDAEDLTQEIFMQMVKSLPGLKDAKCFKSWIFRIAINRVKDFHRKKILLNLFMSTTDKDETEQMNAGNQGNPVNHIMQKEFWTRFHQFADSLSRWEREIFLLRFADNLEIREIAETLQKNENTVKTHLYRALKKFKENNEFYDMLKGNML